MKTNKFIHIFGLLFLTFSNVLLSQTNDFDYKRTIEKIEWEGKEEGIWCKVLLPKEIFSQTNANLSDLRILGIKENGDTIEAPYLLNVLKETSKEKSVSFKRINSSVKGDTYFWTYEVPESKTINQIDFKFLNKNFDWKIDLEGSHNQKEWFKILDDYRILSIKNEFTNYEFTKLVFPDSNYRFFRFSVKTDEKLVFDGKGKLFFKEFKEGLYEDYEIKDFTVKENKKSHQTEINFSLKNKLPLSYLKFNVLDSVDYFRSLQIKYLVDSFKTDKGWKYNYRNLSYGNLNSVEGNDFVLDTKPIQKLKIIIENDNNSPLKIKNIEAKGFVHELWIRFNQKADYFLVYGNENISEPIYDVVRFKNKIPENLTSLDLGNEIILVKKDKPEAPKSIFENKIFLWVLMGVIILVLGFFSLKMIKG